MYELKELGNIELLSVLLSIHYMVFGYFEEEMDMRVALPSNIVLEYLDNNHFNNSNYLCEEYKKVLEESTKRGLIININNIKREYIYTEQFQNWYWSMRNNPIYIREIWPSNLLGQRDISYVDDIFMGFDYPVRNACKILNEKGYVTYWSSANYVDINERVGHVIKDKNVGYILIEHCNLSDNLKNKLILNGNCSFWGIANSKDDEGKYYGIWSEITSKDMKCSELSDNLTIKSLELPMLTNNIMVKVK